MSASTGRGFIMAMVSLGACSPSAPETASSSFGEGGEGGDGGDGSNDADATRESSETSGIKFDLGADEESEAGLGEEGQDDTCSKVDVVLAVDASSSMASELATLPATFLLLVDTLATEVGNGITDFRIAVINACPHPAWFHDWAAHGTNCNFPPGRNWLASTDPQIIEQFACVVDLPLQNEALAEKGGDNGGYEHQPDMCSDAEDEDEQPAWTAAQAVQPGVVENAEFMREDAIVFVIAITDEDEALVSVDSPTAIHDALISAKHGLTNNITFLGIGGEGCPSAYDGSKVDDSSHLRDIADSFGDRGLFRTMCADQGPDPIAAAFEEALTTIVDAACDQYTPQG